MAVRSRRLASSLSSAYALVADELQALPERIRSELTAQSPTLQASCHYQFSPEGRGKGVRPVMTLLMARVCNHHQGKPSVTEGQRIVAMVTEMIHSASLIHDDVIDQAGLRRSRPAMHRVWGERKAALTGNFILSRASEALSRVRNTLVVEMLAQVIEDLVAGEVAQLQSGRGGLDSYIDRCFRKTASLMAHSCQAVAELSGCPAHTSKLVFDYGRSVGLAFQLGDDMLDFTASEETLGKPVCADLSLGIVTAPVLLAVQEYPELQELVDRKFCEAGDSTLARELVLKSSALRRTEALIQNHCSVAVESLRQFKSSAEREALNELALYVAGRRR